MRTSVRSGLVAVLCLAWSCAPVLGEYTVRDDDDGSSGGNGGSGGDGGVGGSGGSGGAGGVSTDECVGNDDCGDPMMECDRGRCARRCVDSTWCPGSTCFGDVCIEPLGTPCEEDRDCGYTCLMLDSSLSDTSGYCSRFCVEDEGCSSGYQCIDFKCHMDP